MNTTQTMNAVTLELPATTALRSAPAPTKPSPVATPAEGLRKAQPVVRRPGHGPRWMAAFAGVIAGTAGVAYYERSVAPFESTDDAFIEAHVTPVAPQVSGLVVRVLVEDNQEVRVGDLVAEIDPRDYQAQVDQATAGLAAARSRFEQAEAQVGVDAAKVDQERANLVAVEAEAKRSAADARRFEAVGITGISQSQLDLASTQAQAAAAQVAVARGRATASEAQLRLDKAGLQTAGAEVRRNEAALHQASLNLSYTRITAPVAGRVTHRTVEAGAYLQVGQPVLALAPHQVWVVANFKETQLALIRPGQPVSVKVDAFPQMDLKGRVDSIQAGAGARFSLFPPENASGNYVKVVQRVPVKITLDPGAEADPLLAAGMSVEPQVRVR